LPIIATKEDKSKQNSIKIEAKEKGKVLNHVSLIAKKYNLKIGFKIMIKVKKHLLLREKMNKPRMKQTLNLRSLL